MLIVILCLIFVLGLTAAFLKFEDKGSAAAAGIISSILIGCVLVAVLAGSYTGYLSDRSFYSATMEQYSSAIVIYNDYAEIDVMNASFTDIKYNGYQDNIAGFVKDLRRSIVKYNRSIIKKRIMDKNPLFSWLVIAPDDDMKIIKMKTVMKEAE